MVTQFMDKEIFCAHILEHESAMYRAARSILNNPEDVEDAVQEAICAAFGATVTYAKRLMHGKQSLTTLEPDCPIFAGCPKAASVARYHSLAVLEETLPECLQVTARTEDGEIMAVQHTVNPVYGLQFHPESILTPDGKIMLQNFLKIKK